MAVYMVGYRYGESDMFEYFVSNTVACIGWTKKRSLGFASAHGNYKNY